MESATARVRMMVGALAETGFMDRPSQPAAPMPVIMEKAITRKVERVPYIDFRASTMMTSSTANMIGTRVCRSLTAASAKALSKGTPPVM